MSEGIETPTFNIEMRRILQNPANRGGGQPGEHGRIGIGDQVLRVVTENIGPHDFHRDDGHAQVGRLGHALIAILDLGVGKDRVHAAAEVTIGQQHLVEAARADHPQHILEGHVRREADETQHFLVELHELGVNLHSSLEAHAFDGRAVDLHAVDVIGAELLERGLDAFAHLARLGHVALRGEINIIADPF